MKAPAAILSCILILWACTGGHSGKANVNTVELSGTVLQCDSLISASRLIYYDGRRVIASTSLGPHPIQLFSIMDDSLHFEGAFLNKGRGPNELVSPSYYADSSGLYIADNLSASGRLYEYSYSEDKGLTMKAVSDLSGFRPYFFSDKFIRTGNGKFIVAGGRTNNNEIISFIDLDRNESIPLDFWPEDGYEGIAAFKQVAYCGNSSLAVNGKKLMYGCDYGRYLDIMTIENHKIAGHNLIYGDLPTLQDSKQSPFGVDPESEFGGLQAKATDRYIYVRHLNKYTETTDNGYPWNFNDEIEVFDWDGNPVCRYHTDKPFSAFHVSPDDRSMLTLSTPDPESQEEIFIEYSLESDTK